MPLNKIINELPYLFGDNRNGTISLLIGIVASVVGSYFKYVSKQTIKTVKK